MKKTCVIYSNITDLKENRLTKYNNTNVCFDVYALCSENKSKILKKDIDLDLSILDNYEIVCLIGAEPLKYIASYTGITKYNGMLLDDRYFPIINPKMIEFRPDYESEVYKAMSNLHSIVSGNDSEESNFKDYRFIDTCELFDEYLVELEDATYIAVDTETTGFSPLKNTAFLVALSTIPNQGVVITAEIIKLYYEELQEIFNNKIIIFHNAKFDMKFMKHTFGFTFNKIHDTMLLHYVLKEEIGTHDLKTLCIKYTDLGDYERDLDEYKKKLARELKIKLEDFTYDMFPLDIIVPYAQKDADGTMQLFHKFYPLVYKNDKFKTLYETIILPCVSALQYVEECGGPVDINILQNLVNNLTIEREEAEEELLSNPSVIEFQINQKAPFNYNSPKQVGSLFFDQMNLPPVKLTNTGNYSTDAEVLEILSKEYEIAKIVLEIRSINKLISTYLKKIEDGLDKDSRLRGNFNIHGTTSGRLSSSGVINYQNIPRDDKEVEVDERSIKQIFTSRPGYKIIQADLATAEVYYAAVLSNDDFLKSAFINKLDFHSYVAKRMFNLDCEVNEVKKKYPNFRQISKAITFGIMYQAGPSKIAEEVNNNLKEGQRPISVQEAERHISRYFQEAKSLKDYINDSCNFIEQNGFIYSYFGRKRRLSESQSENRKIAKHAVRSGFNFLIQSVASDINLLGLIDLVNWIEEENLKDNILPFTIVHDSIVSEVKEECIDTYVSKLREFIQRDRGISIPGCPIGVDIEIGDSWSSLQSYESWKKKQI